ncbi:MAG: bifunctional tetrahydrofolate synthase/dihydrofolate synthase, partial [Burkholderiales bacterium]|nr:bifunctional tetrahydrofolate synthase/dihydrofolate synthase [Burkholderiales bacterium]
MATARTLAEWLAYIERQHPSSIALGLERVEAVRAGLGLALECPVITVGGTNGKGSTCAMLEAVLRAAGYRTALYTSPHLLRYNERVRIDGREADDAALCDAFAAVDAARGALPLTYFEFGTLGALWLFARTRPEVAVLEVGLGGRLDAVNVIDPDCAVLTAIDIDHREYLGATREDIGREKAGILRAARPAVIGDPDPPRSLLRAAQALGARVLRLGEHFGYEVQGAQWRYWGPGGRRFSLAHPALRGQAQLANAATAVCALEALNPRLPVSMQQLREGLARVELAGRFQVLAGRPSIVLDVAHNPQAARTLAANLGAAGYAPRTIAVLGMLADKDIDGVVRALAPRVARWELASLPGARGARAEQLAAALARCGVRALQRCH